MPERKLTPGEKLFLLRIFGNTLPYESQLIGTNDQNYGGSNNSITMATVPRMATSIWKIDYNSASVADDIKWIFVHEFGHVWHWHHVGSNIFGALFEALKSGSYAETYEYDLSKHPNIKSYDLESQASIIADYFFVLNNKTPKYNVGTKKALSDYVPLITQVMAVGPPGPSAADYLKTRSPSLIRPL